TCFGLIQFVRVNFVCAACRDAGCPLDARLGHTEYATPEAKRMVCYAAGQKSFDAARDTLRELCHLPVSDAYIRQLTEKEGPKIAAFAAASAAVADEFAA